MIKNLRKEIRYCDWLVWISFGLMLIVKFFSIFLFVQVHEESGAALESVATNYEANPFFKIAIQSKLIGYILSVIILPASVMAYYYYMRRKVLIGKVELDTLTFFVQFAFFAMLINIVNDGAALFSKLYQMGL